MTNDCALGEKIMLEESIVTKLKNKAKQQKKQVLMLYIAYKKKETPLIAKIFTILIVAYALSPIDLIPDFIPIVGYLDDLIIIPVGIKIALKLIPSEIIEECNDEVDEKIKKNIPEAKIASVLIVLFWILLLLIIVYNVLLAKI